MSSYRPPAMAVTPKTLEAIEDAAALGAARGAGAAAREAGAAAGSTPLPRDAAAALAVSEHYKECGTCGHAAVLWEEIGTLRKDLSAMKLEQTKLFAVIGFWKWALPIIAGLSGAVATVLTALFLKHH